MKSIRNKTASKLDATSWSNDMERATKSIKHIMTCVAVSLLIAGCTATNVSTRTDYAVDKIEFQKNGFMSDADAGLLVENAKRSAALQG